VAVASTKRDVDPIGACVGLRGTRIQVISRELRGEKIDIIEWSHDPATFVARALSPAKVSSVTIDESALEDMDAPQPSALVIVPDNQLSLAIGKKGQNARLAAKLTLMRIDIKSESEIEAERAGPQDDPATALRGLAGITPEQIETLEGAGLDSPRAIVEAGREKLHAVEGIGETAETLYAAAERWVSDHPPAPPAAESTPVFEARSETSNETA
jgi:transcription termination/antitermination protein NusA